MWYGIGNTGVRNPSTAKIKMDLAALEQGQDTDVQTLEVMHELQQNMGMSIILITHDLGVIAKMAHDVAVMYAGQVIEAGPVDDIFYRSAHR